MKTIGIVMGSLMLLIFLALVLNMCGDTAQTVKKEYSPSAMLKKYEYFKDLSAAIDKKRADIEIYHDELDSFQIADKEDKTYYQQRRAEMIGIASMYNQLCADYNSQMSKFNYRFTNRGDLPESNLDPLPREYKPYTVSLKKH